VSLLTASSTARVAAFLNRVGLGAANRFAQRLLSRAGRTVRVNAEGLVLTGPVAALRTLRQIESGNYETLEVRLFKSSLRPGQTVVDVGAHVGFYALLAARGVGPNGTVYAFEPDPRTRPFLEENARLNGLANVKVVAAAASDKTAAREMYLATSANRSSLHPSATLDALDRMTTVDARPVDSVVAGPVDVVKIDAEGAEPEVLRGMEGVLSRESVLFMEFNPPVLTSAGHDPNEFGRWLFERFGQIERIEDSVSPIDAPPTALTNLRCSGWRALPINH
jgi:FkbM family methyltransferase